MDGWTDGQALSFGPPLGVVVSTVSSYSKKVLGSEAPSGSSVWSLHVLCVGSLPQGQLVILTRP